MLYLGTRGDGRPPIRRLSNLLVVFKDPVNDANSD